MAAAVILIMLTDFVSAQHNLNSGTKSGSSTSSGHSQLQGAISFFIFLFIFFSFMTCVIVAASRNRHEDDICVSEQEEVEKRIRIKLIEENLINNGEEFYLVGTLNGNQIRVPAKDSSEKNLNC